MSNKSLRRAARTKQDEFYTQLGDINNELKSYKKHFKGKTIYCNCDDPLESNFFKFFALNFKEYGLKKLLATSYAGSPISKAAHPLKIEITSIPDANKNGVLDQDDIYQLLKSGRVSSRLKGDGDFRSPECIALLKEADIVVTNPPFSLFREYLAQLVEHGKKFLIIGNMNAITYKEVFPLIRAGKVWLGTTHPKEFETPGGGRQKFGNILWFTNLDHPRRHEKLTLWKRYTKAEYPKYDNYSAINVDKVAEIPEGYRGEMGVPITYLDRHNPEQFEIVGTFNGGTQGEALGATKTPAVVKNGTTIIWNGPTVDKRPTYFRIIIRRKG